MIYNFKPQRGFSLIELLVVLTIITILMAVVLPNSSKWISSANHQSESRKIQALLDNVKFRAFAEAKTITIDVKEDRMLGSDNQLLAKFEHVRCEPITVKVFPHGTISPSQVICTNLTESD